MKYLITGGCGFIGFHLALELINRGEEVTIIDNFNNYYDPKLKLQRADLLGEATIYKEDILNEEKLDEIFTKHSFDKVIHLAAQPGVLQSFKTPELYKENNIQGTRNVFECCYKHNIKNIVFASSSSVYRNSTPPFTEDAEINGDLSFYAHTKRQNELLAKEYNEKYGLNIVGLRMFNVYGTHGRPDLVFYIFTEALLNNEAININGTGETLRDFTNIKDIVEGIIRAADLNSGYEIINLGNNNPANLKTLITLIEKNLNTTAQKTYSPKNSMDMDVTFADITKAKNLLNWEPKIKLEDGISELTDWHKNKKNN